MQHNTRMSLCFILDINIDIYINSSINTKYVPNTYKLFLVINHSALQVSHIPAVFTFQSSLFILNDD